jgi:hypothetical protein
MNLALLLTSAALAQEVDRYPWVMTLDPAQCESCTAENRVGKGTFRVHLPALARSVDDPVDGSDLLLHGPDGQPLPFAVLRGQREAERIFLHAQRTADPNLLEIDQLDRRIDGIEVDLDDNPAAAHVQVYEATAGGWRPIGPDQLVWSCIFGDHEVVRFPASAGPLRVVIRHHFPYDADPPDITGLRLAEASVDPVELRFPVVDHRLGEDGNARYTVPLPHALPIRRVRLHPTDALFERQVTVTAEPVTAGVTPSGATGTVQRILIGGATVDSVTVEAPSGNRSNELVLYVETQGREPLDLPEVTVELEGEELLLHDPGPGPWTLYAGAPPGTRSPSDLQTAVPELSRMATAVLEPSAPIPHAGYSPPELRAQLGSPGTELDLAGWRQARPIEGVGLSAIPLPSELLAEARPDLGDLRLVDAAGRQIPYLLRRRAQDHDWGDLVMERVEVGAESRITLRLPEPAVPLSTLTLVTEAPLFSRRITVFRAAGAELTPLRAFQWQGQDRPITATLDVDQVVGGALLVQVDNGDNPPLPISSIRGAWPQWEVIAWLPEAGGVRLLSTNPRASAPAYDLGLLRDELLSRPTAVATVGAVTALQGAGQSVVERIVLAGGVAVLVLGLGALTLLILGSVPATPANVKKDVTEDEPQT